MKKILIYGDSNTWGYISGTINLRTLWAECFPQHLRWAGIIQNHFKNRLEVIVEGLPGRTIGQDDPEFPGRNGRSYLLPCLMSHRPLDMVMIMLGTNDTKPIYHLSAVEITNNLEQLCQIIEDNYTGPAGRNPEIFIVAPPLIRTEKLSAVMQGRYRGAAEKSKLLAQHYRNLCNRCGYYFYDASFLPLGEFSDGIHLDKQAHQRLGRMLCEQLEVIFPSKKLIRMVS